MAKITIGSNFAVNSEYRTNPISIELDTDKDLANIDQLDKNMERAIIIAIRRAVWFGLCVGSIDTALAKDILKRFVPVKANGKAKEDGRSNPPSSN